MWQLCLRLQCWQSVHRYGGLCPYAIQILSALHRGPRVQGKRQTPAGQTARSQGRRVLSLLKVRCSLEAKQVEQAIATWSDALPCGERLQVPRPTAVRLPSGPVVAPRAQDLEGARQQYNAVFHVTKLANRFMLIREPGDSPQADAKRLLESQGAQPGPALQPAYTTKPRACMPCGPAPSGRLSC